MIKRIKRNLIFLFSILYSFSFSQIILSQTKILPGFHKSNYFEEQIRIFESPVWAPEVKFHINAPSTSTFDPSKEVLLIFFTLPNGNTTDQTIGKTLLQGDDWHFDIQNIGAQTRYLRNILTDKNVVTAYLESLQKSWPAWRTKHPDAMIKTIVDSVRSIFSKYNTKVVLSGHSGGGSFIFGFINSYTEIPPFVQRIAFLDANYAYDEYNYKHGAKLSKWLNNSPYKYLSVLAYNDSVALIDGKPIVSDSGGTWVRSKMMIERLKKDFSFNESIDNTFWKYDGLNGRVKFILKTNPDRLIYHTVQVEMNGFIHALLTGRAYEESGYKYFISNRVYSNLIQSGLTLLSSQIPPRPPDAKTGSQFMNSILNMNFAQREPLILDEFKKGNIPDFMRKFKEVKIQYQGKTCILQVMPDYLCIGSDSDFCRVPMGPKTAQEIADFYGCTMPTPLMVDSIWKAAPIKLSPVPHAPVGNANELVSMFITHNQEIEQQRISTGIPLGEIVAGIKKDVVITNRLKNEPTKVAIYGWHYTSGVPIQPLTTIHVNSYVDYSHGIRLVNSLATFDGTLEKIQDILSDANLYTILSNESGPMTQPKYLFTEALPAAPKSFFVKRISNNSFRIYIKPDPTISSYNIFLSKDCVTWDSPQQFFTNDITINNLELFKVYYVKIQSYGTLGLSDYSEVLSCSTSAIDSKILLVNGFDRLSVGNTRDIIKYHAKVFKNINLSFSSSTNDAMTDGLIDLNEFQAIDYILGDESTADEIFSTQEQEIIKKYLENGGRIFISGSEVAWDLDAKGSLTDKDFCYNYLGFKYVNDAPLGKKDTYYSVEPFIPIFGLININEFSFDNGTNGTNNVSWPDAVAPLSESQAILRYKNVDTSLGVAGTMTTKKFGLNNKFGMVTYFSFPFETIYPEEARNQVLMRVFQWFHYTFDNVSETKNKYEEYKLSQNYPNPFNPSTKINFYLPKTLFTSLNRDFYTNKIPSKNNFKDTFIQF